MACCRGLHTGLITSNRLKDKGAGLAARVQRDFEQTGSKQRCFTCFRYKADSWDRSRRVIAKVGEVENRIKELNHEIKADRLIRHRFLANRFRLLLHTAAYCLLWLLRQHLHAVRPAR